MSCFASSIVNVGGTEFECREDTFVGCLEVEMVLLLRATIDEALVALFSFLSVIDVFTSFVPRQVLKSSITPDSLSGRFSTDELLFIMPEKMCIPYNCKM